MQSPGPPPSQILCTRDTHRDTLKSAGRTGHRRPPWVPPSSGLWRPGGNDTCGVMPWWEGGKRDPDSCATRKPLPSTCRGSCAETSWCRRCTGDSGRALSPLCCLHLCSALKTAPELPLQGWVSPWLLAGESGRGGSVQPFVLGCWSAGEPMTAAAPG